MLSGQFKSEKKRELRQLLNLKWWLLDAFRLAKEQGVDAHALGCLGEALDRRFSALTALLDNEAMAESLGPGEGFRWCTLDDQQTPVYEPVLQTLTCRKEAEEARAKAEEKEEEMP